MSTRKIYIRTNGAWERLENLFVRNGGGWERAEVAYLRQGGAWVEIYRYRFIYTLNLSVYSVQELNLRNYAIAAGWNGVVPITVNFNITGTGWLQAPSTSQVGLNVSGYWPTGSVVNLNISPGGVISGYGGAGGNGGRGATWYIQYPSGFPQYTYNEKVLRATPGNNGGDAIYLNGVVMSINNQGIIAGGGGGGAGGWSITHQDGWDWANPIFDASLNGGGGGGGGRPYGAGGIGGEFLNGVDHVTGYIGISGVDGGTASQSGAGGGGPCWISSGYGGYWMVGPGGTGGDWGQAGQTHEFERWEYSSNAYKNGGPRTPYSAYLGFKEIIKGGDPGNYINGVNWVNWVNTGDLRGWAKSS